MSRRALLSLAFVLYLCGLAFTASRADDIPLSVKEPAAQGQGAWCVANQCADDLTKLPARDREGAVFHSWKELRADTEKRYTHIAQPHRVAREHEILPQPVAKPDVPVAGILVSRDGEVAFQLDANGGPIVVEERRVMEDQATRDITTVTQDGEPIAIIKPARNQRPVSE